MAESIKYPQSDSIKGLTQITDPFVIGTGDMWPITWADDDNLYGAAGDNNGFLDHFQTMNLWKITGFPPGHEISLVNTLDFLEPAFNDPEIPIKPMKPAGIVSVDDALYLAVEDMKYTSGRYGNQINLQSWIIYSTDHGKTWSRPPSPKSKERRFLTGIFASPHFLQFGRDYSGACDEYVYAYSCAGDDGVAAWSAGDYMYLARVPRDSIMERKAWEFYCGGTHKPSWTKNVNKAVLVFEYPRKTGENEVVYNPGLDRYILLNWAFIDCVAHGIGSLHSELTILEAPEPWGPWSLVYIKKDWGKNCDYQPRLPTKWISRDGEKAWLASAGNFRRDGGRQHYGFVVTQVKFNTRDYGDTETDDKPKTVQEFKAEALSPTEIKLSWLPRLEARFYRIFKDDQKLPDIPARYPAQYIDRNVSPETKHTYSVQTFTACGDSSPISEKVEAIAPPELSKNFIGINLGGGSVATKEGGWLGEESQYIKVIRCGRCADQRIEKLRLIPNPGEIEPILRAFRGSRTFTEALSDVKVVIGNLPFRKAKVFVYAVNTKLSETNTNFNLYVQGVKVQEYKPSIEDESNWHKLGPFIVKISNGENLVIEGQDLVGLGGIAGISIERVSCN
ncbi:hypothetical protein ES703_70299 [subsurface metagenome]